MPSQWYAFRKHALSNMLALCFFLSCVQVGDMFAAEAQLPDAQSLKAPYIEMHAILEKVGHIDNGIGNGTMRNSNIMTMFQIHVLLRHVRSFLLGIGSIWASSCLGVWQL